MKTTMKHDGACTPGAQDFHGSNGCASCMLHDLCQSQSDATGRGSPPGTSPRPRILQKGAGLFRAGDAFRALFLIRSGCVKTSMSSHAGGLQILRFSFPGELLGIDAIAATHHPSDAVALETTHLCEIPFARLEALARTHPDIQHRLLQLLSDEIARDEKLMALLGHQKAEVRLADCLLDLHWRCQRPGQMGVPFRLPMSRQDIADYLGLSLETVSRLLTRFQKTGLLQVQGRALRLLDASRLRSIGNPGAIVPARMA